MKYGWLLLTGLVLAATATARAADDWAPAHAPLMTRWAAEVSPTNAHPEYPRPQMVRSDWLNLNGLWDYAIRPLTNSAPEAYDGKILVPFPVESALSGVMKPLDEDSTLWYRRVTKIPAAWKGRRVRLNFEAADWECRLMVNGRVVGLHRGGYNRFSFDITDYLRWEGDEEIIVAITDPTEGDQPRGKQSRKPEGIFYTSTSGLWQTVWMEPVPTVSIDGLRMTPDLDVRALRLRVAVNSDADDLRVEAIASDGSTVAGKANADLMLPIPNPRLWSPSSPFLYDLHVKLTRKKEILDSIRSYFGMRKISLAKDDKDITRLALNGQPLFQIGVLDQGFWPDGIYTAPTDAALRSDVEFLKSAGFNLARKHVKVEPDRWYYWCDKLGLLVWQDMPSGNNATPEGEREFETELTHMVGDLYNHPSIVLWVLFNEGWGQYDTYRLVRRLKALDPSRLVDNASGWSDARVGDVVDSHMYPGPSALEPEAARAVVLGEFGGLGYVVTNHCWSTNHWSYQMETNASGLAGAYSLLLRGVWNLHNVRGLSAAIYTQTSDVETECNGLLSYDRAVAKIKPAFLAKANVFIREADGVRVVVSDAVSDLPTWRYTETAPSTNWSDSDFNDSEWKTGTAGFGTVLTPGSIVTTEWNTPDIWLRRQFVLGKDDLDGLKIEAHHDEDAEIYFNGVLAAKLPSYITHYQQFDILPEALHALKAGTNTLAVHCHQTIGGQYIDVGLVVPTPNAPDLHAGP